MKKGSFKLKVGLAEMLKGGVIMDVVNEEQAKIAENSGAVSVMALERIPADIKKYGGIYKRHGLFGDGAICIFSDAIKATCFSIEIMKVWEEILPSVEQLMIQKHTF